MSDTINELFKKLMSNYLTKTKYGVESLGIIKNFGEDFFNDHVAFRSFQHKNHGIKSLEKVFLSLGYEKMDNMEFKEKNLNAYWYKPPTFEYPKVFISEIVIDKMSIESQKIINKYLDPIKEKDVNLDSIEALVNYLELRPWSTIKHEDYLTLSKDSEYAAWTLVFGNKVNHFTISVNHFKNIRNIYELNSYLELNKIPLNNSSGVIKGKADTTYLLQSSTIANKIDVEFQEGTKQVAYAFMEFSERFIQPEQVEKNYKNQSFDNYFQAFVPDNADKIFESTYSSQANRQN